MSLTIFDYELNEELSDLFEEIWTELTGENADEVTGS